jgi:3-isopropylmalate dehydratase small subunit
MVTLDVNGKKYKVDVPNDMPLLWALRDYLKLTGTKYGCGIGCVVAKSFARIFYRNSINVGLPILICPEAVDAVKDADEATVDIGSGKIVVRGKEFKALPFPQFLKEIIELGG